MSLFATLVLTSAVATSLAPTYLRCDYLVNPLGINDPSPRFSWVDVGGERDTQQSSYRIEVASTLEKLTSGSHDLWDSGQVKLSDTNQISYAGTPLVSGQRAWWRVTVTSNRGDDEIASKPAFWEAGILSPADWTAKWISYPGTPDPNARPAPCFRREFAASHPVASARIYATARGLYRLFLDGKPVGDSHLTPGWTDYHKHIQYQTYDVTRELSVGKHAVGIEIGDGWYCGHVGLTGGNNYGDRPMALVKLAITYKDGSHEEVSTDGSWKAHDGPIRTDDLLMGENYDARKELGDWSDPGYKDEDWVAPEIHPLDDVLLVGQRDPTVQKLDELKPIAEWASKDGTYVFDLGQNMVGWARLKVKGPAGTTVRLRFAEMLNPDKSIYTTNLRGAKATDDYTLKGSGAEIYEPTFTFHGFRYVELQGYPGTPGKDAVTGVVVGSNNPQTGTFSCSDPMVNKLQHNIFWGQRGNYVSIPTDCPQRDERLGWMGDAEIFARTATFNNDVAAFLTKFSLDEVDAQSKEGGFSDVSPRVGDPSDGAPAWGDAGVIVPWTVYLAYGDKDLLARRYTAMLAWIDYIDSVNPNHLWIKRSNNNFGDWLNVHDDTPREVLATAFFAYSTGIVAKTARLIGKTADAERLDALHDEIVDAYRKAYVDADGKIQGDSQTDYVMALKFGLLSDDQKSKAVDRLVDHIVKDRQVHLSTGFVGSGLLNPTLTDNGRTDVAYKLLLTDTYPSWLYTVKLGATTMWERWDGWTPDKGFEDPGMNSFNHYSFGAVGEWMYSTVGGIDLDPDNPGYRHIIVKPIPGGGLTWAKTSLASINGLIKVDWTLKQHKFELKVTVPSNTSATIYIPTISHDMVSEGSDFADMSEDIRFVGMQGDTAVYEVGGGDYHFRSVCKN